MSADPNDDAAVGDDGQPDEQRRRNTRKSKEGSVRPSVHLLLVRHAESQNNEVYRRARHLYRGGTPDFDLDGWNAYVDEHRSADPGLSERGRTQADRLAEYLVRHLGEQASMPVRVVTSPMRRTLETIRPTLEGLRRLAEAEAEAERGGDEATGPPPPAASVIANAFYHESEGCHIREVAHPGMNRSEIASFLSADSPSSRLRLSCDGFDPDDADAGWYSHGAGAETRAESEVRAAKFYLWLCEHLDSQLSDAASDPLVHGDVYDAGVAHPGEEHELDHLKFQPRRRRRRTCVLVGHGDFMGLVLKRVVAGFGHCVESEGVPHRSAFVHFNTGITELEYFGAGRFLVMGSNRTPHLDDLPEGEADLKTGGGLKDGWSYLVPDEEFLLDAEVDVAFEDELEGHVREQAEAMRELYLGRRKSDAGAVGGSAPGSRRISRANSLAAEVEGGADGPDKISSASSGGGEVTLVVKRGLQVVGCASLDERTGRLADVVVRPSARNSRVGRTLVRAARDHAKRAGVECVFVEAQTEESRKFFESVGFLKATREEEEGNDEEGVLMELTP